MTLDAAFWISFALSLVKLLEIALNERQQKAVQDLLDTITLRLSYVSLSGLYAALKKTRIQVLLAAVTLILCYAVMALYLMSAGVDPRRLLKSLPTRWVILQAAMVLTIFPIELRWLVRSDRIASFVKRAALVFSVPAVAILISVLFDIDIFLDSYPTIRLFVLLPVIVPISVCLYSSIYVLMIKSFQAVIWFLTKVLWRVVEYPKGAWAALLFVATGVLGVAKTLVAGKH